MHLIELIAELEAVKVARGNIRLVDVIVMAAGDQRPIADFADRAAYRASAPQLAIDVTGMAEDQIDEILAESPTAKLVRRAPEPNTAPGELCNVVDVAKGACTLPMGHAGEHMWTNPDAKLDPVAQEVAKQLEGEGAGKGVIDTLKRDLHVAVGDGAEVIEQKPTSAAGLAQVMETAADKLPESLQE